MKLPMPRQQHNWIAKTTFMTAWFLQPELRWKRPELFEGRIIPVGDLETLQSLENILKRKTSTRHAKKNQSCYHRSWTIINFVYFTMNATIVREDTFECHTEIKHLRENVKFLALCTPLVLISSTRTDMDGPDNSRVVHLVYRVRDHKILN